MGRPRKNKIVTPDTKTSSLLEALKFLSLVTKDIGPINETHVLLHNKYAIAFNGVLSAGTKIDEEIIACPQNKLLLEAISKCGQAISFEQQDSKLLIKSGKFKANVPCIDLDLFTLTTPDIKMIIVNDELKKSFEAVAMLANENGQSICQASVLMNGQSAVGTNGYVVFEYWHGFNLPVGPALPKTFIQALSKTNKKLTAFGISNHSVTFWFEDESWLKTQLYAEQWPDIQGILDRPTNPQPFPVGFWEGIAAVAPFSEHGNIYFDAGMVHSHPSVDAGASFQIEGLPRGPIFSVKQLKLLEPWATSIDWFAPAPSGGTMTFAYGQNMRGVIAGRRE